MTRLIESLRKTWNARMSKFAIVAAAAGLGLTPSIASAREHDLRRDRDDDRGQVRVDIRIGDGDFGIRLPAPRREPVYEERVERVWVAPVYRTVCDRVWVEPVVQDVCDRVWIEPVYRDREVVRYEGHHRYVSRESVLIQPGHWEDRHRQVVVSDGHWENVERQELVAPGHWEYRTTRVRVEDRPTWGWDRDWRGR